MDQPFKVANVICRFNSSSGGPPRTVSLIAQAGSGQWLAELFTTDYTEPRDDTLLIREFPGHVNLLGRNAQTLTGGALLGDRIRMVDHTMDEGVFIRSMASRGWAGAA